MSDSMERDKNDPLANEEKEAVEAQMKQELLNLNMYEPGYTYKQMREILDLISESKKMANDNKNTRKESFRSDNDSSSEMISKINVTQELETHQHNDVARCKRSYRHNRGSPELDRIPTQGSSNPEPQTSESRISLHRHKSSDSEDMFDRSHDSPPIQETSSPSTNRNVSSRTKNTLHETQLPNVDIMMDTQLEYNHKPERWKLDPLESCVSDNDVPLRRPDRPPAQDRNPFRHCRDAQSPDTIKKQHLELKRHLKETAELWQSRRHTTDSKFQWGSPIQVGPAKSSLDKKPLTNVKTEQNEMECKYSYERPNKRKSASILSSPSTRHSSSDDDSDFVIVKKKKIQPPEGTSRVLRSRVSKDISVNVIQDDEDELLDDEITRINSENTGVQRLQSESLVDCEEKSLSPVLMATYPKRIVPPNPRNHIKKKKEHNAGTSTKDSSVYSSDEELSVTLIPKEKSNTLTDEEIRAEFERDENDDSDKVVPKNVEIKPLPLKRLSVRLEKQFDLLRKNQTEQKKRLLLEKEEAEKKAVEEKQKKEKFYKRQVDERRNREKQVEEIEKSNKEKSTRWNNMLNMRSREQKEKELLRQREARLLEIDEEENRLLEDSSASENEQMQRAEDCVTDSVNCPICNKSFPSDKIETHAAECEQYNSDSDDGNANLCRTEEAGVKKSIKRAEVLECNVCLTYRTTNGIDYEEHVNNCLQKQRREGQSRSYECRSLEIDNVPMSPVRCYRSISEQNDSEIDYKAQFASNSRTHVQSSKRRKR